MGNFKIQEFENLKIQRFENSSILEFLIQFFNLLIFEPETFNF